MTLTSDTPFDFLPHETWWRDHYDFFEKKGYTLRDRYRPGWVPSWMVNTDKEVVHCEDGVRLPESRRNLLDARRVHDGVRVSLKRIDKLEHPHEIEITSTLSLDRANHYVPVYDVLEVPDDDSQVILVMPLLRDAMDPSFDTVGEVIDCVQQLLEGLQFMHRHHVAHGNCTQANILMDSNMFIDAWHPIDESMSEDLTRPARHRTRTQSPPRYYYVDFSISRKYGVPDSNTSERPQFGGDNDVPGSREDSTNPFAKDVECLGHAIKDIFLKRYSGVKFLNGLVSDMMHTNPAKRPNMDVVVSRFKDLRRSLGAHKLRSRVAHVGKIHLFGFISHWIRRIQYITCNIPPTHTPIL